MEKRRKSLNAPDTRKHQKTSAPTTASEVDEAMLVTMAASPSVKVREFPMIVPMENDFNMDNYYVRDCYPTYYALVMDMLGKQGLKGVTVTGTPGIGKSVFMAYFFQVYSTQFPTATITMVSYSKKSIPFTSVTTFKGRIIKREERTTPTTFTTVYESLEPANKAAMDNPGAGSIWLLDGPPDSIPKTTKWVSFTSPNEDWLAQMRKNSDTYGKIYMPVWTLDELYDAVDKLKRFELLKATDVDLMRRLGIPKSGEDSDTHMDDVDDSIEMSRPTVLEFRYNIFGGDARACFQKRLAPFIESVKELEEAVSTLTTDEVVAAIKSENAPV